MTGTATPVDALYQLGRASHEAGDLAGAKLRYLDVLQADPNHADALHMLGNIDLREGRLVEAERLLRRAIELAPSTPGYNTTLGNLLRADGRSREAAAAYRRELELRPDFAAAHNQLGLVLMDIGQTEEALKAFRLALSHVPTYADACLNMGRALNNLRRLPEAQAAFEQTLRLDDGLSAAHNGLGHVRRAAGDIAGALACFERALASDPENLPARKNLAATLVAAGRSGDAVAVLTEVLKAEPGEPANHVNLGVALHNAGKLAEAVRCYEAALERAPEDVDARTSLGAALHSLGRDSEAAVQFSAVLETCPGHGKAVAGLAGVLERQGRYGEGLGLLSPVMRAGPVTPDIVVIYAGLLAGRGDRPQAIAVLQRALTQDGLVPEQRSMLLFKQGDVLHAEADYEGAFASYAQANALRPARFDADGRAARIDRIVAAFDARRFAGLPRARAMAGPPVFVVGMPHSGVLAAQSLLEGHPAVVSAGAPRDIGMIASKLGQTVADRPYPDCVHDLTAAALTELAQRYTEKHNPAAENSRICDARWINYEHLGLIALLFPGAPVVHCVRPADDIALACFFRKFYGNTALPFSHDLADIGAYYNGYRRLMKHWTAGLKIRVLEVSWQALVKQPREVAATMLSHAGLNITDGWQAPELDLPMQDLARHYGPRLSAFHAVVRGG